MLNLDYSSKKPLYLQIKENIIKLILTNSLSSDSQIPTVRDLASQLSINPNTIQKAYRELEQEGYIYSVQGKGSFVCDITNLKSTKIISEITNKIDATLCEAKSLGMQKQSIQQMVDSVFKEENK